MANKPKKVDLTRSASKHLNGSRVLVIFVIILAALLVLGGGLFAYEWQKLKNENDDLATQLHLANKTIAEVNEVNSTEHAGDVTNATNNTTPSVEQDEPDSGAQVSQIKFYLVAIDDNGKTGEAVGCGDSLVAVSKEVTPTSAPLEAALKELLALKDREYGNSGLTNALYQSKLQIKELSVQDGTATIKLTGTILSGGTCDDPRIIGQIKATALQFSTVKEVDISVNDVPLDQLF